MGLLSRRAPGRGGQRLRPRGGAPAVDPACGDPRAAAVRAAAVAADWDAVRDGLAAAGDAGGEDVTWLLSLLSDVPGVETWIPRAVAAEPDSALPLLVAGARGVSSAWEARTAAPAAQVSQERFTVFHDRLRQAEDQLYEVAEREPRWLAPWYFLLISGRGLQIGPDPARQRFEAAVRRLPGHWLSHRQRLQQVCLKWGGSHEEMHAFARTAMLDAPEGSPLRELVALAHLEEWLDLGGGEEGGAYLRRSTVLAQLYEAVDRSVLHADFRRGPGWAQCCNTFAMAFSLAGEHVATPPLFAALGGTVTELPWAYLDGDPAKVFASFRRRAGR